MNPKNNPLIRRAVRVNERYALDGGGYLASSIAYYGFLSLFPLLLLALSVVGFLLASNPQLQAEMREAITGSIPGLDALVGRNLLVIQNSRVGTGIVALLGLVWTGSGIVGAGRNAILRVFRQARPPRGLADKAWVLAVTIVLGIIALAGTGIIALIGTLDMEGAAGEAIRYGGIFVAFALDLGLFLLAYRLLARRTGPWKDLLAGALFAAVGWTGLKLLGTWYGTLVVERSGPVYGSFAGTVGMLVLLYLSGRVFVYGAELNAVLMEERGGGVPMDNPGSNGETSADPRDVSTVRLVGQVAGDVGSLVKKEVELARQEIMEGVTARLKAVAAFAATGVIAMFFVGFLAAAGAAGLALVMPLWLALLIVAGVFALLALIAAVFGKARIKSPPLKPEKTKQTIKEDVEWAKAQLRR